MPTPTKKMNLVLPLDADFSAKALDNRKITFAIMNVGRMLKAISMKHRVEDLDITHVDKYEQNPQFVWANSSLANFKSLVKFFRSLIAEKNARGLNHKYAAAFAEFEAEFGNIERMAKDWEFPKNEFSDKSHPPMIEFGCDPIEFETLHPVNKAREIMAHSLNNYKNQSTIKWGHDGQPEWLQKDGAVWKATFNMALEAEWQAALEEAEAPKVEKSSKRAKKVEKPADEFSAIEVDEDAPSALQWGAFFNPMNYFGGSVSGTSADHVPSP